MTTENKLDESLRESGWNGFIGFSIKAKNTEDNSAVHTAFKEFSKMEAKDDHTLALRLLLGNWQDAGRFDVVWDHIRILEERLVKIEQLASSEPMPKKDEKTVMF